MRTFVHNFIWLLLLAVAFEQAACKVYVRRRFDPEEQAQARFTAGFINKFSTTTTTTTTTTAPATTTVSSPVTTTTPATTTTSPAPAAASPTATATARDTFPTSSDLDSGFFNDYDGFGKANDLSGDFSEEPEDSVSSADYESDAPANYVRMQKHRQAPAAAEQEEQEETDDNSDRMHSNDDAEDDDDEDAASADDDEEGQENAVGRAARAQPSEWNRRQMNRRMTNRQIQRLENEYKRRIKTLRERQKEVLRRNALRNRRTAAVRRRRLQNRQREIEKRTRLQRQRRRRRLQNQRRRRQQKQKARRRQIQNQNRLNRFRRGGGNRRIVRVVL